MTNARSLDPPPPSLDACDAAVRAAYQAAQASGWAAEQRRPLWEAAVQAVLLHAAQAADTPRARRHYWLIIDLAPEILPSAWGAEVRRALRLAATHTLVAPGKPERRPRAQQLLKRLDLLENPVLEVRERVFQAIARQNQRMREAFSRQASGERASLAQYQAQQARLGRVTTALRHLPVAPGSGQASSARLLERLHDLVETGAVFAPELEVPLYSLLQCLAAAGEAPALLAEGTATLETILAQGHPGLKAIRDDLIALMYEVVLAEYRPEQRAAVAGHLADLAYVGRHLHEIPADHLPALLFRLRMRLMDPDNEAAEPVIDAGLQLQDRLDARRKALDGTDQRTLDELTLARMAIAGMRTAGVGPAQARGILKVLRQLEDLIFGPRLDEAAFTQTLTMLTEQLRRPALIGHRPWQTGRTAMIQLGQQREGLEERLRGLALDRQLGAEEREALRRSLERRIEEIDRARLVFGSLPLERVGPGQEQAMLAAITEFSVSTRIAATTGDTARLRAALEQMMQICRSPM